jgi:hypothetical protein
MVNRTRIGLREIRTLGLNEEIWDSAVPGFGARRRMGNRVTYIVMYRTDEGRLRRFTIGRHGAPWTPDNARVEARRILGEVASGADPAAEKQSKPLPNCAMRIGPMPNPATCLPCAARLRRR